VEAAGVAEEVAAGVAEEVAEAEAEVEVAEEAEAEEAEAEEAEVVAAVAEAEQCSRGRSRCRTPRRTTCSRQARR
jgi:hypothetical protein